MALPLSSNTTQVYPPSPLSKGEPSHAKEPLLRIENLSVTFDTAQGPLRAVTQLSLDLALGEMSALVGESGCGKSVTAMSILRLLDDAYCRATGHIFFEGIDLLSMKENALRRIRGNDIAMIFQEPMTALNPVFTVGDQIAEVASVHRGLSKRAAFERAVHMLEQVGIPDPASRAKQYPHELSGGMRQRVMIAMAIICEPKLLIADEPTTALDVTVQAQILALLRKLQTENGMAILLITHDLGVVAEVADSVSVMYAGELIERATAIDLFDHPAHPYTKGLLNAVPRFDRKGPLEAIPGRVPRFYAPLTACAFNDRCAYADDRCRLAHPEMDWVDRGRATHAVRCVHPLA